MPATLVQWHTYYWLATYTVTDRTPCHAGECLGEGEGGDQASRKEGRIRLRSDVEVGNEFPSVR
jgi:hypothetical protein